MIALDCVQSHSEELQFISILSHISDLVFGNPLLGSLSSSLDHRAPVGSYICWFVLGPFVMGIILSIWSEFISDPAHTCGVIENNMVKCHSSDITSTETINHMPCKGCIYRRIKMFDIEARYRTMVRDQDSDLVARQGLANPNWQKGHFAVSMVWKQLEHEAIRRGVYQYVHRYDKEEAKVEDHIKTIYQPPTPTTMDKIVTKVLGPNGSIAEGRQIMVKTIKTPTLINPDKPLPPRIVVTEAPVELGPAQAPGSQRPGLPRNPSSKKTIVSKFIEHDLPESAGVYARHGLMHFVDRTPASSQLLSLPGIGNTVERKSPLSMVRNSSDPDDSLGRKGSTDARARANSAESPLVKVRAVVLDDQEVFVLAEDDD